VLEVRHARRGRFHQSGGLFGQRAHQVRKVGREAARVVAAVQAQVGGDLVVAAAPGAELAAEFAEAFDQAALERGVDVLVGDGAGEGAARDVLAETVQSGQHPLQFGVVEEPRAVQYARMGFRGLEVVRGQPPVEADRRVQGFEGGGGAAGEAAPPQFRHYSASALTRSFRAAASFAGRLHSSTKPRAFDWSNVSPSS
jgi:hypothetical protein